MTSRRLLDAFRPGERVFIAGSASAPVSLLEAWTTDPDRARGLDIVTSLVPGINAFDLDLLPESAGVTGFFMRPEFAAAQRAGRYRHLPLSYGGIAGWLNRSRAFDVCVIVVAAPDSNGQCSLGVSVEFIEIVRRRAKRVIGIISHAMPKLPGSPSLLASEIELLDETDCPLPRYETGRIDNVSRQIGDHIARYVRDGAIFQAGLGKVPNAIMEQLTDRRNIRFHSGMIGDGAIALAEAGALDLDWVHRSCVIVGTPPLYAWAQEFQNLAVSGCDLTHSPAVLASLDGLVAVNSAVEVDLFGQCNLEVASGAGISGPGGAPDFARGARMARDGLSIVALPSTASRGTRSRIVSAISAPGVVTLGRYDVDLVVTEHGIADLRDASAHERAEAIIMIAAPEFQRGLDDQWRAIAARL